MLAKVVEVAAAPDVGGFDRNLISQRVAEVASRFGPPGRETFAMGGPCPHGARALGRVTGPAQPR